MSTTYIYLSREELEKLASGEALDVPMGRIRQSDRLVIRLDQSEVTGQDLVETLQKVFDPTKRASDAAKTMDNMIEKLNAVDHEYRTSPEELYETLRLIDIRRKLSDM